MTPVHATTVARFGAAGWRGVLLTGPSGAGKSDLALRLIGAGWRLVSDDYSEVWRSGDAVYATAPATIVGRIEARGLGVIPCSPRWIARIALVVVCGQETVERMPEPAEERVAGVALQSIRLDTRAASAVEIVVAALAQVQEGPALHPRAFPLSRPACGPGRRVSARDRVAGAVVW